MRVDAEVAADQVVEVLRLHPVLANQPQLLCASAASFAVTRPASPNAPRFLLGKNEKQPIAPIVPTVPP